ncbi:MaoC family dehydratase [Aerococcaceae bacterium DSM 111021]|nr:MaoC family dehydratase [Aerococcaceae bacterium DSM 111021]
MNKKVYRLDELNVGDTIDNGSYQVTKDEIIDFAQKFDPQFYHCDEDTAKNYQFGGLIASGWHTASIAMGLVVRTFNIQHGMIGAMVNVTWPAPTRPGDILNVKTEILNIKPSKSKPYQAIVSVDWHATNQNGDILLKTSATIVMFYENPTTY